MDESGKGWMRWLDSWWVKVVINKKFCMENLEKLLIFELALKVERLQSGKRMCVITVILNIFNILMGVTIH